MGAEQHAPSHRKASLAGRLGERQGTAGPRLPTLQSNVLRLQRTLGNTAVTWLLSSGSPLIRRDYVQREDGDDEAPGGVQTQLQVLANSNVPNLEREAHQMERAAIESINSLALLIEDEKGAETKGERLSIDARRRELVTVFELVRARRRDLARALDEVEDKPSAVLQALSVVAEIDGEFIVRQSQFHSELAANTNRSELTKLATPSTPSEISTADSQSKGRLPSVTADDIREIQNWVGGGWSTMNRYMFGIETNDDRGAREAVLNQPLPADPQNRERVTKNQWEMNVPARARGLAAAVHKLPRFQGTTYRRATPLNNAVYGGVVRPGDFLQSPGFFATSMVKGGGGAAGGSTWGKSAGKAYFEVTGVSGRDLGPYQENLSSEREVLYPANAVFEVKAIEKRAGATFVIVSQVLVVPEGAIVREPYAGQVVQPPYADAEAQEDGLE